MMDNQAKHTPGPWKVDYKLPTSQSPCRILGDGEVARVTYRGKLAGDSWEANAHLITAAPELLEACRYAVENLRPKGTVTKDFSGHNAMATLSKAIAKAEGQS
jgi:hypothetical protein